MALIKCPECGEKVSSTAISCPKCGYNVQNYYLREKKENKKRRKLQEKETQREIQKEFANTTYNKIILTMFGFLFVGLIIMGVIGVHNVKLSMNRYIYSSEIEMLNDLQGMWVSYFTDTRMIGSTYYTFNTDYTMVQTDYDDNGDIEYTNTWAFSINPEKGLIYVKDKECDLYEYDGEQFFRQYITTSKPKMLWKRVE